MEEIFQESYLEGEPPKFLTDDEYGTGTHIRTFNIIDIHPIPEGFEVNLSMDLDSGYEIENAILKINHEDLQAYETNDVHSAVKCALGFFEEGKSM